MLGEPENEVELLLALRFSECPYLFECKHPLGIEHYAVLLCGHIHVLKW